MAMDAAHMEAQEAPPASQPQHAHGLAGFLAKLKAAPPWVWISLLIGVATLFIMLRQGSGSSSGAAVPTGGAGSPNYGTATITTPGSSIPTDSGNTLPGSSTGSTDTIQSALAQWQQALSNVQLPGVAQTSAPAAPAPTMSAAPASDPWAGRVQQVRNMAASYAGRTVSQVRHITSRTAAPAPAYHGTVPSAGGPVPVTTQSSPVRPRHLY